MSKGHQPIEEAAAQDTAETSPETPQPPPLRSSIFDVTIDLPAPPPLERMASTPPEGPRDERRRLRRVPYDEKVALWQRGPEGKALCWPAWGLNLSSGGIRLIINRRLAQGEQVGIQLQPERRALPGRVAWVKTHPDGCVVGICFTAVESSPPL